MDTTPPPARRPKTLWWAVGLVAALLGGLVAHRLIGRTPPPPPVEAALFKTARPLPPITLVAHDGTPFDLTRLRGHYTLLFFGFTHCPDVCPTTLSELAAASRALADLPAADRPAVVMISVDPKRDTPAVLADYVAHFDPAFTGATGPDAALTALTQSLGAVYEVGPEVDGAYRVDHTAAVFLINPDAALLAVFPPPQVARTVTEDYRRILAARNAR